MLRRCLRSDEGFTLPELLITMAIISIIAIPLGASVTTYMLNAEKIRARQFESKDQQLAAQYWSSDVDSLGTRDTITFAALPSSINTGDCMPYPGAPSSKLISLQWTNFSFTGLSTVVTSSTTSVTYSSSGSTIVRTSCASGSAVSNTIANTVQVDAAHPIQCSTDGTTFAACTTLSGSGSTGVYLKFYVADASGKGQNYWSTLGGQRRQTQ